MRRTANKRRRSTIIAPPNRLRAASARLIVADPDAPVPDSRKSTSKNASTNVDHGNASGDNEKNALPSADIVKPPKKSSRSPKITLSDVSTMFAHAPRTVVPTLESFAHDNRTFDNENLTAPLKKKLRHQKIQPRHRMKKSCARKNSFGNRERHHDSVMTKQKHRKF